MRRRESFTLLSGAAVAWPPLAGGAQQPSKLCRLGYLSTARVPNLIDAMPTRLRELGYFEGKNLRVEYPIWRTTVRTSRAIASQLVELPPDAIITPGTPATFAPKRATTTIPIVQLKERRNE
jgi:putative tryptophan/tyrosine transport system substrate-binding protein